MTTYPLVSVVIPVYNGEIFLQEAIDSILTQSYSNIELILVNDASSDGSIDIIHSFNDKRIIYLENPKNLGIGLSRKIGIEHAKGKYIALLDQDDIAYPDRLQKQVEFMERNQQIGASSGHADIVDKKGILTGRRIEAAIGNKLEAELIFQYVFNNPASIYKREAVIQAGNFRDEFCEDYSLLIRIAKNQKIANIPYTLIKYRIHGENTSIKKLDQMLQGEKNCIKLIFHSLKMEYNEEMVEHIYNLKPGKNIDQKVPIKIYHDLLVTILNKNKEQKYFNQTSLKKVFSKKWIELNKRHNHPLISLFFKSPLFSVTKFKLSLFINIFKKSC